MADRPLNFIYREPERAYVPGCLEVFIMIVFILIFVGIFTLGIHFG